MPRDLSDRSPRTQMIGREVCWVKGLAVGYKRLPRGGSNEVLGKVVARRCSFDSSARLGRLSNFHTGRKRPACFHTHYCSCGDKVQISLDGGGSSGT